MNNAATLLGDFILTCFLCGTRLTVALMVAPFFGGSVSGMSRQNFFVICQAIVTPILYPTIVIGGFTALEIAGIAVKEALIGATFGFIAGILFWAIDGAAELIDLQRGATSAGVFNPQFGVVSSPLAGLISRLISAIFYAIGGFLSFLGALFASYFIFPVTSYFPQWTPEAFNVMMEIFAHYFQMMLQYAAPLLILFFIIDFGLGLMNRFVPHLNVFFLSLPIKSAMAFFFLLFYIGFVVISFKSNLFSATVLENFLKSVFR